MKALLFALCVSGLATAASAQSNGTLVYQPTAGAGKERYVFGFDASNPKDWRPPSLDLGSFAGLPKLEGAGYSAQLFYSLDSRAGMDSLAPVPGSLVGFRTGSAAGLFFGKPELEIPFTHGGDVVALQLRAWDTEGGVYNSYAGSRIKGFSDVFTFELTGTDASGISHLGERLIATKLQHFQIFPVPEPSVLGLGALVAWAWIVRSRGR